jgi:hypothetical protein
MIKLVVENTTPEGRRRSRDARVQIAFANVASTMLRMLSGKRVPSIVEAMEDFISVCRAIEEADQADGVQIRFIRLNYGKGHADEPISAILRGALNVVAERIDLGAKYPLNKDASFRPPESELKAYHKANDQLVEGINLLLAREGKSLLRAREVGKKRKRNSSRPG